MEDIATKNSLQICSYNCNSIRKKVDIVRQLMNSQDIILLQEIILLNEDTDFIYGICDIFDAIILPSKCPVSECFEGRPSGGLAILWRKSLNISVNLVTENDNFIVALLNCTDRFIGLVNIYMPYDNKSNDVVDEYSHILGELQAAISELPTDNILCLGDFNADPTRGRLWFNLEEFCQENEFCIYDLCMSSNSFTFLSPSHNSTSWIDHVLRAEDLI